ncbi:hypothetical protein BP00DRAFT_260113 [Aspergillus indologenus CBS 114.80]|uniref:Protein kinase domain-containing protein n=1 Tax=Aspergillus indologenus CBS 114.80 TaxID=1450541 RepID=A0A2V5HVJ9_9EURO|nr:hypothetical protein BP00DRAFT_260113 [Aspergillus indologenus CBS 114.80]
MLLSPKPSFQVVSRHLSCHLSCHLSYHLSASSFLAHSFSTLASNSCDTLHHPHLSVILFDLPQLSSRTSPRISQSRLDNPCPLRTSKTRLRSSSNLNAQPAQTDAQYPNTEPQIDKLGPANMSGQCLTQDSLFPHDPYLGLPVIGNGMTGIVLKLGEDRAVKKAKQYQPGYLQAREDVEYMNDINRQTLENEIQVFKRLGSYEGIIPYFQTSQYGIELALAQGNLECYLETYPERENSLKISWMSSLIKTLAHVHSHRVFVDDIALRNILILDGKLKLADFGQSILLPLDIDIASANKNDLNVRIEILHLGWVLYSIASWHVHKYYFFGPENHDLCWPETGSFPNVDDVLWGRMIKKCWHGQYGSMDDVKDEAYQLLTSQHEGCDPGNDSPA